MKRRADLMLLLVTVCWGVSFPAIKSASVHVSPALFVALRFTAASLIMLAAWPWFLRLASAADRASGRARLGHPAAVRWGLELGVWIALGYTTQTVGLQTTSANTSAFITALSVILVPVFLFLGRGVRPRPVVAASVALALLGLGMLTRPDLGGLAPGDLWTLGTAVAYAVYLIRLSDGLARACFLPVLWWTLAVCAVLNIVLVLTVETPRLEWGTPVAVALAVTTLLSTLVALGLQNRWQGETTATRAALIFSTEPVFAALFSLAWLGERLGGVALAGAALILAAVTLTETAGEA
ncbi:MAG TPA: DMT family transporter [Candidatus Krumholzibacteria bacterium]|nr:DMT family transporter [Candidatus Krumholzibacteria bacterium]HRX50549.1 DMT family transporter [Candidatus Krumholzibacteria bacterium]